MLSSRLARIGSFAPALLAASLLAAPALATSSAVSHSLQLKFEAIDVPLSKASGAWTRAVAALPSSASTSQLDSVLGKASPGYDAALKTFDAALQKLALPGAAGKSAASIVKEDKQFEALLANTHLSTSQFVSQFRPIFSSEGALASQFKAAMGLQADASMVI
jgi:hypothetical protein